MAYRHFWWVRAIASLLLSLLFQATLTHHRGLTCEPTSPTTPSPDPVNPQPPPP